MPVLDLAAFAACVLRILIPSFSRYPQATIRRRKQPPKNRPPSLWPPKWLLVSCGGTAAVFVGVCIGDFLSSLPLVLPFAAAGLLPGGRGNSIPLMVPPDYSGPLCCPPTILLTLALCPVHSRHRPLWGRPQRPPSCPAGPPGGRSFSIPRGHHPLPRHPLSLAGPFQSPLSYRLSAPAE